MLSDEVVTVSGVGVAESWGRVKPMKWARGPQAYLWAAGH